MTDIAALQTDVHTWFKTAFGPLPIFDQMFEPPERAVRLFEEVVETAQTLGVPLEKLVHTLLYTYARPVEPDVRVEVGGSLVTLCLLASALRFDLGELGSAEVRRAYTIIEKARVSAQRKVDDGTSFAPVENSTLILGFAIAYLRGWCATQRDNQPREGLALAAAVVDDALDDLNDYIGGVRT